jgi:hypothetical protein
MAMPPAANFLATLSGLAFSWSAQAQSAFERPQPPAPAAPFIAAEAPPLSTPPVTYALLPGHWQLHGWKYVWVPPETVLRRVEDRPLVLGRYVWRGGRWVWVPTHYGWN